jgi:hypothetical protein
MYDGWGWRPYVSVAQRRQKALKKMEALRKKGRTISPVSVDGRTIAKTFWGKAWCDNLESYSDYENRLPRGRTYVRNGSVVDLLGDLRGQSGDPAGCQAAVEVDLQGLRRLD